MQDGWLIPVFGLFIGYIYVFVITSLSQRFPRQTLVEFAPTIVTKPIGIMVAVLFGLKIIITSSLELRLLCEIIKQVLLPETPTSVIMMVMLFTVAYLVRGGIEPYARMGEILVFAVFIPLAIVFAFIVAKADYRQLLPILQSTPPQMLKATYLMSLTFMPLEFMLLFTAFMGDPKQARRSCKWAIVLIFLIEMATIMLTYVSIGVLEAKRNFWPVLTMVQNIQFPGAFIENQEIAMISCWILSIFVYISGGMYSFSLITGRLLKLKKDNLFVLASIPLIYILAMLPSSFGQVYRWDNIFRGYFGALFLFPIPLILLIIAKLRKQGEPYDKI